MGSTLITKTPTRPILGPLTTTFTAPSSCSAVFSSPASDNLSEAPTSPVYSASQGIRCDVYTLVENGVEDAEFLNDNEDCWPSAMSSKSPGSYSMEFFVATFDGWGFYSPGLLCPNGYTSACSAALLSNGVSSTIANGQSFEFQFPLVPGETAVGCCPRYVS
ncbi:hypothetical protein EV356DRAFT_181507 [Viridothelium virens]|uniref:Uncharacterized protein n=1 Tax=Viridothelium virens TaxID=1048519 RepID=A0A6A6H7Q8_VIRVR|nr:hypothetical protein EV356DRAFT_181507 [Viridothelium virens]